MKLQPGSTHVNLSPSWLNKNHDYPLQINFNSCFLFSIKEHMVKHK